MKTKESKLQINATPAVAEEYFYNAMCNGLGYVCGYGLQFDYNSVEYNNAKAQLKGENNCFEDILMQVLRNGGSLTFVDIEGEGDMTRSITLKDVHKRMSDVPAQHLIDMDSGNDDATTADIILQTVFFEEIVFG